MTRLLFLTGPGGAGTTTFAAATALRAARDGDRVLLLGVDDAGALHAVLDGAGHANLVVQSFEPHAAAESALETISKLLSGPLSTAGFSAPEPSELGAVPGLPDVLALRLVSDAVGSGDWDAVVVDGPPLRPALDLLAWPETAAAALRRIRPIEGQAARSLRPLLAGLVGLPSPLTAVTKWTEDAAAEIAGVRRALAGPGSAIRLVGSPARSAQPLLATARTMLALQGLRYDGDMPLDIPRAADEPIGADALAALADAVYGTSDPLPAVAEAPVPRLVPDGDGYRYELALPGVERNSLNLVRGGDEIVVTVSTARVASHRRAFVLPATLRRCRITSARLEDGVLRIGFKPDETLWPERLLPENDDRQD